MLNVLLQAVAGLVMLYCGGEWLVRGASALAARLGVSALAIGLTVVAFGTSAPELVVSLDAALSGANDISVGNVVGSNIANVALILGLAIVVTPAVVESRIVRVDAPLMIAASLALLAVLADGVASRVEGAVLLAALAAYVVLTFRQARRESAAVRGEFETAAPAPPSGPGPAGSLALVGLGLGLLVGGGHWLVTAAVTFATAVGISQAVIGLTVVAVGTSLPELATSLIAAARGQGDIAIGNVIGSNLFNILGILAVTALVHPLERGAITWTDLGVMTALAVLVTIFLATGRRLTRVEGAVLLGAYVAYTGYLAAAAAG